MSRKEKGVTALDRLCHKLYDSPKGVGYQVAGQCQECGGSLMTYYCEDQLYLIVCQKCGAMALTKSCTPQLAANCTLVNNEQYFQTRLEFAENRAHETDKRLALAIQDMNVLATIIRKHKIDNDACCFLCHNNTPPPDDPDDDYCPGWDGEDECFIWRYINDGN